jgi:hypothetical protein
MIDENGGVKVIDFGIAQMHEDEPRKIHQLMGTPSYMSPEQKEDPNAASFASDIFSLGIISYELVLGKLSHGMINLSLLPAGLQRILDKALAISIKDRYQDIVTFIHDLTDYYKSPKIDQERPSTDLLIEMGEILQTSEKKLSQFEKPSWSTIEVGISQERRDGELGLYLDFFRFPNNVMTLICAHTTTSSLCSVAQIASLSGMIKGLIAPHIASENPFAPSDFTEKLNTLVFSDRMKATFHLNIVKLVPIQDTVIYLSCGPTGPLFHVPRGKNRPRTIHNENPLIGEERGATFSESADTLDDGDLLVFHNLEDKTFSTPIGKAIVSHALLSPARLTESIILELKENGDFFKTLHSKLVIALRRIN